jgi:hypothetical protein
MSLEIARRLRDEATWVREMEARMRSPDDQRALAELALRLTRLAETLERDARD